MSMVTINIMVLILQQKQTAWRDMAVRDGPAGLLNRRKILRILARELDHAKRRCSEMSVMMHDIDFNLTFSIGLASYPNHAIEEAERINKADMALYLAKKPGRNQVCIASGLPTPTNHAKVIDLDNPSANY